MFSRSPGRWTHSGAWDCWLDLNHVRFVLCAVRCPSLKSSTYSPELISLTIFLNNQDVHVPLFTCVWGCNAVIDQSWVHMPTFKTKASAPFKPRVLRVWDGYFPKGSQGSGSRRVKEWLDGQKIINIFKKKNVSTIINVLLI